MGFTLSKRGTKHYVKKVWEKLPRAQVLGPEKLSGQGFGSCTYRERSISSCGGLVQIHSPQSKSCEEGKE